MSKSKLPVQKKELITISITGFSHDGTGIGRYGGLAVFVPGALPGETVLAEITALKKNYALARLLDITAASEQRIPPCCPLYNTCGGCRLQHVQYREQLQLKSQLVQTSLTRIAGLDKVTVLPTTGMDDPWHYRNKVHFQVAEQNGALVLGFYQEKSHQIVPLFNEEGTINPGCLLISRELNQVASLTSKLLNKYGLQVDNPGRFFRHVVLRKASGTREIMVVIVTRSGEWLQENNFAGELRTVFAGILSVVRNINEGPPGIIMGGENKVLAGQAFITDKLGHLTVRVSPASFYQVNPDQTLALYRKVQEYAGLTGVETVVDAYCGAGTIALFLAAGAKKIYGLEINPAASADARNNASLNQINNTEFQTGAVEKLLPAMAASGETPDVAILDPPRRGCARAVLEALVNMKVRRLIYVSCDHGTMARDAGYLVQNGYMLNEVQPVDMFPWTAHIECVVLMENIKNK